MTLAVSPLSDKNHFFNPSLTEIKKSRLVYLVLFSKAMANNIKKPVQQIHQLLNTTKNELSVTNNSDIWTWSCWQPMRNSSLLWLNDLTVSKPVIGQFPSYLNCRWLKQKIPWAQFLFNSPSLFTSIFEKMLSALILTKILSSSMFQHLWWWDFWRWNFTLDHHWVLHWQHPTCCTRTEIYLIHLKR